MGSISNTFYYVKSYHCAKIGAFTINSTIISPICWTMSTIKRFTKVTMGDRSFMAAAPRLWNSRPVSIRSACTKSDFKQKLEAFLLLLLVQL